MKNKVSVTVDRAVLEVVDAFAKTHRVDRSRIFEEGLRLWMAARQAEAMEEQLRGEAPPEDERQAWDAIRRSAATRRLG